MDVRRFDRLARGLVASSTRRLTLLSGLGALAASVGEGQAKKKKKKCKKCQPQCAGRECGPNSCPTGDCGTCTGGDVCNILGQCVECRVGQDCAPGECKIANCVNENCQFSNVVDETPCLGGMGVCCNGLCQPGVIC